MSALLADIGILYTENPVTMGVMTAALLFNTAVISILIHGRTK